METAANIKRNKSLALMWTVLIHGGLFLLFILVVFHNPDPPLFADNSGVEVNFGNSEEGIGDIQPEKETVPEKAKPQKQISKPVQEKLVTQQTEETPVTAKEVTQPVKEIKQPVKEIIEKPKEEPVKQPVVNPNALYKGKKNNATNVGSEGETGKPGDQGIKEGSLYAKKHGNVMGNGDGEGNGNGNGLGNGPGGKGISYSLSGRKMVKAPEIFDKSQESGKVVVSITVDKNGNVTRAVPGARGSTTTSAVLYSKAQQAALKARFDANPEASEEQHGTITFIFILQ